jgi:ribosome-binding protein aMBF1 (putative translation factor)
VKCNCCCAELAGKGQRFIKEGISYGPYCDSCYSIVAEEKQIVPAKKAKTVWERGPDANSRMQKRSYSGHKRRRMGLAELRRYEYEKKAGLPHINNVF